jgi:hypothetical protein
VEILSPQCLPFSDFFPPWCNSPQWARAPSLSRLHDHTQTHTTLGVTPLGEWSARRRDLYLTTHKAHKRQTSVPLAGFEPAIPASERPQTHALDRASTGIGPFLRIVLVKFCRYCKIKTSRCITFVRWQHAFGWDRSLSVFHSTNKLKRLTLLSSGYGFVVPTAWLAHTKLTRSEHPHASTAKRCLLCSWTSFLFRFQFWTCFAYKCFVCSLI